MIKTVLIAEDERSIRDFITVNLQAAGFQVLEAADGFNAIEIFEKNSSGIDVALLDIMMPGCDGFEVCRKIRNASPETGIIFLSAKTQEDDKINGLSYGADDYITKPFSTTELIARVNALYRRVEYSRNLLKNAGSDVIKLGGYELDLEKHKIYHDEKETELTQIEFQILKCFFDSPDTSIERNYILKKVWGEPYYGDDKVVDVNIRRLRLKLEKDPSNPEHLITVGGQGYRWIV